MADFHLLAEARGRFQPPRLLIESTYPLALFRTWTWLSFNVDALVYPRPVACDLPRPANALVEAEEGELTSSPGVDDFYGFKRYQPGDSLKQVHWPSYAKGQAMQVKEFGSENASQLVLDLNAFSGSLEERLSGICYWLLHFHESQAKCLVDLAGQPYGPGSGEGLKSQVLAALALFSGGDHA